MSDCRARRVALLGAVLALGSAASAWALDGLPPAGQVNDDSGAGIDRTLSVAGENPTNADVVGGALTAGRPAVPWAIFRQQEPGSAKDQLFVRSFAGGTWTTRGSGTVGGQSSAIHQFSGSLNFNQNADGEAPALDFAGADRKVPWATWYEQVGDGAAFSATNIFASRFDNTGDADQGKWIFGGQNRGTVGGAMVPSINIRTSDNAENPSVAGGSATDASSPGPWIAWQEEDSPTSHIDQIFVARPSAPGQTDCDSFTPAGRKVAGHVSSVGGFCWQQTGIRRAGATGHDPSLNVDPTRHGVEPDIAFTGKNSDGVQDGVPWVVWYEKGTTDGAISHLTHDNEMVFAARGISDRVAANGGFNWTVVGDQSAGLLDAGGTNHFGACAASDTAEQACSLNKNPNASAQDPRVASGTMKAANPTVPWVAWDEQLNGVSQIFVSRLVGTGPTAHFELANNGAAVSTDANPSTRPDITFDGNTPYVSWREDTGGGVEKAFAGHFVNPANPTFVLDDSDVPLTPSGQADVREPISSGCIATPFNADGAACQGAAVGTPFFLFTNGTSPRGLFADAYRPDLPVTGTATGITIAGATLNGSVNPAGASVKVFFQFGPTTSYGQSTAPQPTGPMDATTPFSAIVSGLPPGTVVHFRAVATSDFGTFAGADEMLRTGSAPPPPGSGTATVGRAAAAGKTVKVRVACTGRPGATCALAFRLTVAELVSGHRVVGIKAQRKRRRHKLIVGLARASVTLSTGRDRKVQMTLNGQGARLLRRLRRMTATLKVTQTFVDGTTRTVSTQKVRFRAHRKKKHRRH